MERRGNQLAKVADGLAALRGDEVRSHGNNERVSIMSI